MVCGEAPLKTTFLTVGSVGLNVSRLVPFISTLPPTVMVLSRFRPTMPLVTIKLPLITKAELAAEAVLTPLPTLNSNVPKVRPAKGGTLFEVAGLAYT
jgi:hypothetical protein